MPYCKLQNSLVCPLCSSCCPMGPRAIAVLLLPGLGPTPSLASSHPWVYSAHPQMSFISAHVLECSTANCNMHARFCFLLHRDLTFPSNSQAFTASSVRPSSSHFQNWRIFGFTRDRCFSPFAWLIAAKPLHENGIELCRDVHALEDDLELARVG